MECCMFEGKVIDFDSILKVWSYYPISKNNRPSCLSDVFVKSSAYKIWRVFRCVLRTGLLFKETPITQRITDPRLSKVPELSDR